MKNHRAPPRGWLRDERDYLMFEKNSFFFEMGVALRTLVGTFPEGIDPEVVLEYRTLATALEDKDAEAIHAFVSGDRARKLAWRTMRKPAQEHGAFLMMLVSAIGDHIVVESKTPDTFTERARRKAPRKKKVS